MPKTQGLVQEETFASPSVVMGEEAVPAPASPREVPVEETPARPPPPIAMRASTQRNLQKACLKHEAHAADARTRGDEAAARMHEAAAKQLRELADRSTSEMAIHAARAARR